MFRLMLITMCVVGFLLHSKSQSPAENLKLIVEFTSQFPQYNPAINDSLDFSNDSICLKAIITMIDDESYEAIHIKAGTTIGGDDILDYTFTFGGSPPSGTSFIQDGNKAYMTLGNYYGVGQIYAEVIMEDQSANLSTSTTTSIP